MMYNNGYAHTNVYYWSNTFILSYVWYRRYILWTKLNLVGFIVLERTVFFSQAQKKQCGGSKRFSKMFFLTNDKLENMTIQRDRERVIRRPELWYWIESRWRVQRLRRQTFYKGLCTIVCIFVKPHKRDVRILTIITTAAPGRMKTWYCVFTGIIIIVGKYVSNLYFVLFRIRYNIILLILCSSTNGGIFVENPDSFFCLWN